MKYKAILLDLDGTVSSYATSAMPQTPSPKVVSSLQLASQHMHVGLATSRPIVKIKTILKLLKLKGYSILHNGAQIIDSDTTETVWKKPISPSISIKLYRISRKYKFNAYLSDFFADILIKSEAQLTTSPIANIFFEGIKAEDIESVEKELSKISRIAIHQVYSRQQNMFELGINDIRATKQHAVIHVAKLLGIKTQEIIGVGDGYNDNPLLMACGLKIAMGNAVPELKAIADFVAPPVDDDGVATVIDKFILHQ